MKNKKLYRNTNDKMIAGVCAGIADYFGIDKTIVRLITVLIWIFSFFFTMILVYLICCIIIPPDNNIIDG